MKFNNIDHLKKAFCLPHSIQIPSSRWMENFGLAVSLTRFLNKFLPHFDIILNWLHIIAGEDWVLTLTNVRRICLIHFRNSNNCNEEYGRWNKSHNRHAPHKHSQAAFHSLLLTPEHDNINTHDIYIGQFWSLKSS